MPEDIKEFVAFSVQWLLVSLVLSIIVRLIA